MTAEQRLAALEAEVAELRRAAVLRDVFVEAIERRGYRAGRESVLGAGSGSGSGRAVRSPQAGRWLHAAPEAGA